MSFARITPDNQFLSDDGFDKKTVLVPSTKLSFFFINLPTKNWTQGQKIAPFTLEEDLAEDIEKLHVSIRYKGDKWLAVICTHDQMKAWIELANSHGCNPQKFIPDVLALPESIDLLIEPDQILLNKSDEPPFALKRSIADQVFKELAIDPEKLETFQSDNYMEAMQGHLVVHKGVINLIQGLYSHSKSLTNWLMPWGKSMAILVLAWVSYTVYLNLQNIQIEDAVKKARIANIDRFRKTFPDIQRIVDIQAQSDQQFKAIAAEQQRQSASLIYLMSRVVSAVEKNSSIFVEYIRYRDFRLQIQVTAETVSVVDGLLKSLKENQEFNITVDSLNQDNNQVNATINLAKI